jgi:hypothetical protein
MVPRSAASLSLLLVLFPGIVAQAQGGLSLSFGAGLAFPAGDFRDQASPGLHTGIGAQLSFGRFPLALALDGSYSYFPRDTVNAPKATDRRVRPLLLTAGVSLRPFRRGDVRPYLRAGAGWANSRGLGSDTFLSTRFAWQAGGGLLFPIGRGDTQLFLDAGLVAISARPERTRFVPLVAGVSLATGGRR